MRVLALDTTTRRGSVALVEDDRVLDERAGDPSRAHVERLPGEILALTAAHGLRAQDIDVFAVASGPGSFTGLRIGIATIQGMAMTTGRRVVAVSALDALAHMAAAHAAPGMLIAVWMDAHREDVFTALYRVNDAPAYEAERLHELDGPAVGRPGAALERWGARFGDLRTLYIGDGAELYAPAIEGSPTSKGQVVPLAPLAGAIGRLAVNRARRQDTIDPAGVQPLYVRRPDAEVERERRTSR
jgi:tRNA threonylcarbamoyladenosine biosynthesis protein TsaB